MEIREGHNKFYINDKQGKQIAEIVFVPTGENLAISNIPMSMKA